MIFGYARVSTQEQNLRLQEQALRAVGAGELFADKGISGNAVFKPELLKALDRMRAGDVLVVWRLDRLSRSLRDLIDQLETLKARGIEFRSLHERIETDSPMGKLFFHIVGAFAEFERELIRDRTLAGIAAARASNRPIGRPPTISAEQWDHVYGLMTAAENPLSPVKAAKVLGVTRQAVHLRLKRQAVSTAEESA